ncbi:MAG: hypothetical protein BWY68_00152 [bacterium ADurb.Bin400]|nr:MAG: hypothetical protein BWY68_00152 [bacterium ADurb.Bin400]
MAEIREAIEQQDRRFERFRRRESLRAGLTTAATAAVLGIAASEATDWLQERVAGKVNDRITLLEYFQGQRPMDKFLVDGKEVVPGIIQQRITMPKTGESITARFSLTEDGKFILIPDSLPPGYRFDAASGQIIHEVAGVKGGAMSADTWREFRQGILSRFGDKFESTYGRWVAFADNGTKSVGSSYTVRSGYEVGPVYFPHSNITENMLHLRPGREGSVVVDISRMLGETAFGGGKEVKITPEMLDRLVLTIGPRARELSHDVLAASFRNGKIEIPKEMADTIFEIVGGRVKPKGGFQLTVDSLLSGVNSVDYRGGATRLYSIANIFREGAGIITGRPPITESVPVPSVERLQGTMLEPPIAIPYDPRRPIADVGPARKEKPGKNDDDPNPSKDKEQTGKKHDDDHLDAGGKPMPPDDPKRGSREQIQTRPDGKDGGKSQEDGKMPPPPPAAPGAVGVRVAQEQLRSGKKAGVEDRSGGENPSAAAERAAGKEKVATQRVEGRRQVDLVVRTEAMDGLDESSLQEIINKLEAIKQADGRQGRFEHKKHRFLDHIVADRKYGDAAKELGVIVIEDGRRRREVRVAELTEDQEQLFDNHIETLLLALRRREDKLRIQRLQSEIADGGVKTAETESDSKSKEKKAERTASGFHEELSETMRKHAKEAERLQREREETAREVARARARESQEIASESKRRNEEALQLAQERAREMAQRLQEAAGAAQERMRKAAEAARERLRKREETEHQRTVSARRSRLYQGGSGTDRLRRVG